MTAAKTIGILLFDGVEELDAIGPWEVLAYWTLNHPEDGYVVVTVAETDARVTCAKGLRILPDLTLADAPELDVVVYPGGQGTRAHLTDPDRLDWVRRQRATASIMASVCTGSLVFAAAGLLAGRPATTHWRAEDELMAQDPSVEFRRDDRFVDDGDVITSAGVSAGIDMALHLVDRLAGRERAVEVRRGIQYDPQPPV
jgi:transcriptional regulator GlxA family with amidase domain